MGVPWDANKKFADNMFQAIGRTPLVRFSSIAEGLETAILGKIEWFSPTGSLKDRIFYEMITQAVKKGDLRPGMEIIETSTGNAGIACAFVGKMLGYKVTIVMPDGMSEERMKIMRAYGADIIFTPGGESDVDLCIAKTAEIKAANPGKYWEPDQYGNPNNIGAHYRTTGPEIWEQTDGQVDAFVATQGTGGTLTGVGRYLREKNSAVKLYAIEPAEAPMLSKRQWGSHKIEGIGDGFVPFNLDLSLLNGIITTTSDEAIGMGRRLALEEGVFCGISSGSNVAAAVKLAKKSPQLGTIVTMINDTGQRYFSTELCGEPKEVEIPEREHPMDKYTIEQLDQYQGNWDIIE
jgi:cysteine synthase A